MENFDDDNKKPSDLPETPIKDDSWVDDALNEDVPDPELEVKQTITSGVKDQFVDKTQVVLDDKDFDRSKAPIVITSTHPKYASKVLGERYPNDNVDAVLEATETDEGKIHALYSHLSDAFQNEQGYGSMVSLNENEDLVMTNRLETNKGNIAMQVGGGGAFKNGTVLTGRKALLAITSHMGLSNAVQLPDVDSGMRFAYRSPNATEWAALDEQLARHKDELGYYTMGLSHSLTDSYTQELLFNFMMKYLIDCNVEGWKNDGVVNVKLLRQLLKRSSLQSHHLALQAAFYSRGYPLLRVCTAEGSKCSHVTNSMVYFQHSYWILENKLTRSQLRHMTTAMSHRYKPEEIINYQNSLEFDNSSIKTESPSGGEMILNLKVPNLATELVAAERWIARIKELMSDGNRSFRDAISEAKFIRRLVDTNQLALFTTWIGSISLVDGEGNTATIEDRDTIQEGIEHLSSNDELLAVVLDGIWEYIEAARKSIIGVPQHQCGKCKQLQATTDLSKELVPFDATATFFTLLTPTVSRYQKLMLDMPGLA